jgi:hypothetical protein
MQPGSPDTYMTPREASFLGGALPVDNYLRDRIEAALTDWALSVAPEHLVVEWRNKPEGRAALRGIALITRGKEAGEDLRIRLNDMELLVLAVSAEAALQNAEQDAKFINYVYEDLEETSDDDVTLEHLDEEDVELFKSRMFEDKLNDIQMGHYIVNTISSYLRRP